MNAINDFLLNLFTGNDELRPNMMFPNLKDGVVCASDGYVLICIPEDELTLKYNTSENYPNAVKLISDFEDEPTCSIKVEVESLAKELAKCRLEVDKFILKCKECNGSGNVEWEYEDNNRETHYTQHDCPLCDGTGQDKRNHPFARIHLLSFENDGDTIFQIKIGDLYFHPFQLYRLFMVAMLKGYKEIEIFYKKHEYGQTVSYFGKIKVLVMAMLNEQKD